MPHFEVVIYNTDDLLTLKKKNNIYRYFFYNTAFGVVVIEGKLGHSEG